MLVLCCKSAVAAGAHLCRAQRGGGHASRSRQQEILPQWGTAGGIGSKQNGGGGVEMKGELAMHHCNRLKH